MHFRCSSCTASDSVTPSFAPASRWNFKRDKTTASNDRNWCNIRYESLSSFSCKVSLGFLGTTLQSPRTSVSITQSRTLVPCPIYHCLLVLHASWVARETGNITLHECHDRQLCHMTGTVILSPVALVLKPFQRSPSCRRTVH